MQGANENSRRADHEVSLHRMANLSAQGRKTPSQTVGYCPDRIDAFHLSEFAINSIRDANPIARDRTNYDSDGYSRGTKGRMPSYGLPSLSHQRKGFSYRYQATPAITSQGAGPSTRQIPHHS